MSHGALFSAEPPVRRKCLIPPLLSVVVLLIFRAVLLIFRAAIFEVSLDGLPPDEGLNSSALRTHVGIASLIQRPKHTWVVQHAAELSPHPRLRTGIENSRRHTEPGEMV